MFDKWLKTHNIPEGVWRILKSGDFPFGKEIGSVRFYDKEYLMELNDEEYWPDLTINKLLVVGDAINGDFWTLDYRKDKVKVVIMPMGDIPDREEEVIPETKIIRIADSFASFIDLAKADKLPIDYYEAKDRSQKK